MNNKKQIQLSVMSIIIILALALVGCGTQVQAVTTPDEVSVRLAWTHKADFSGYYVADQKEYYEAENLEVKINPIDFEVTTIDKVVSGEDQFGEVPGITLLLARAEGKPVVAVAMLQRRNPDIFVSLAESNITKAEDLIGKRIGVIADQEFMYHFLLSVANIDPSRVTRIERTDFTMRPLLEGEYDVMSGYITNQPVSDKLQDDLDLNIISTDDYGVSIPGHVIFTTEDMIQNNPDLVRRFVHATLKGFKTVVDTPEEGLKATLKFDETLEPKFQAGVLEVLIPYLAPDDKPIGYMDQQVWQNAKDAMAEQGLIPTSLDPKTAYTTQFLEQ
jgi:NitT/TauT family transport system substrate-binding protein